MVNLTIKINLAEKTLSFNESKLELKETLQGAEECIEEDKERKCLEIIYDNNQDIYPEANRIIRFMRENKLGKQLKIRAYEHRNDAVQIKGNYELKIIRPSDTPWEILTQQ